MSPPRLASIVEGPEARGWGSGRILTLAGLVVGCLLVGGNSPGGEMPGEARALEYLAREVPRWARENRCYSCHNNGDAARALFEARRLGLRLETPMGVDPLADTARWLARPEAWEKNGGDGPFSDKTLARVQFTATLAASNPTDRAALTRASKRLAADQAADGSWPIEGEPEVLGSPAAYGRPLATLAARDALRLADPIGFRDRIARADRWLSARPLARVMDASIAVLALTAPGREPVPGVDDRARRAAAVERLRLGQSEDGGWGPYVDSPPEAFDTALALLALRRLDSTAEVRRMIERGRGHLLGTQQPDGSWPETTRPAGAESYAQRLSTTGWATLALLGTR